MTTNEIKTLIQNTIAGQGSQVDIGGKLAEVLNALADAVSGVVSGVDVTDIITDVPTGISSELYQKIMDAPVLVANGKSYLRLTAEPDNVQTNVEDYLQTDVILFGIFGVYQQDGSNLTGGEGILVYQEGHGDYEITRFIL